MNKFLPLGLLPLFLMLGGCAEFGNLSYDLTKRPSNKVAILIDLSQQRAYLYDRGLVVLTARCQPVVKDTTLLPGVTRSFRRTSITDPASTAPIVVLTARS